MLVMSSVWVESKVQDDVLFSPTKTHGTGFVWAVLVAGK
jgi:hypothetical protein